MVARLTMWQTAHGPFFKGESVVYAYVDETGNTGNRIFDPKQPLFITAAMMTRGNFDVIYKAGIAAVAKNAGVQVLYANELGIGKIERIAPGLLKLVKAAEARFFVLRLEKRYLAATKVVDTYFDCGENLAVPWQLYSLRRLRLLLTFKVAKFILTEELAQTVWDCLTAQKEGTSTALFVEGAKALLGNAQYLPDARSRQISQRRCSGQSAIQRTFRSLAEAKRFAIHTLQISLRSHPS
jgi:hypothetical protein